VKKNEAYYKNKTTEYIRSHATQYKFVMFRHEDRTTHGIPDLSITKNRRTVWIEFKYADPTFSNRGIQELTMLRLASIGLAFYVVFYFNPKTKVERTYIVDPKDIGSDLSLWVDFVEGFEYAFILERILDFT